jgi:hypothetical protein
MIWMPPDEYEEIPQIALITSKWLVEAWEQLGKPDNPFTESGAKMMAVIIAVWEELYPDESKQWYEDRKTYRKHELSITEQVHKHTGRSLASYPFPIFQVMKTIFPTFKAAQRENCLKMVRKFPMFQMCNNA